MFSSLGLFASVTCPFNDECKTLNCVFRHDDPAQHAWLNMADDTPNQGPLKRRKGVPEAVLPQRATPVFPQGPKTQAPKTQEPRAHEPKTQKPKTQAFYGTLVTKAVPTVPRSPKAELGDETITESVEVEDEAITPIGKEGTLQPTKSNVVTSAKPISPPPIRRLARPVQTRLSNGNTAQHKVVEETLNPRMIQRDPVGHAKRTLYLTKLHEQMARLNNEARASSDPAMKALALTDGQLITLALDEEQKLATEEPTVYNNVIKLRMVAYKKMTLEQWKMARLEARLKAESKRPNSSNVPMSSRLAAIPIETGLSKGEEVQTLSHLVAKQQDLERFGLVINPPSEEEIKQSKIGVEASLGWETCERCTSRFQVFPDRREDGALTTGGKCTYHHGRATYPDKDQVGGRKDQYYSCCFESVGATAGCTTGESHVFKIYDGKRLASVLQYERTPNNPNVADDQAVAFDCEMGFTVHGMELIRLTATAWPGGEELLDVLVRPLGAIIDLNSRYSGVQPEDLFNALPYVSKSSNTKGSKKVTKSAPIAANGKVLPPIVDSPMAARRLLFDLLSPSTPLIGHAIENDLNAARIVHPCIIDTVVLFPHRRGLPSRRALRFLARDILGRDIQNGGANGHDSKEDALATGDLVRWKVAQKWKDLQREGWTRQEGRLISPRPGSKMVAEVPKGPKAHGEAPRPGPKMVADTPKVQVAAPQPDSKVVAEAGETPRSKKRPIAELGDGLGYD